MLIIVVSVSVMFGFFFCEGFVCNFEEVKSMDLECFGKLYWVMFEWGIYFVLLVFEVGFMFLVYFDVDIEVMINVFCESFVVVV